MNPAVKRRGTVVRMCHRFEAETPTIVAVTVTQQPWPTDCI
jgi:hypothetical protein